MLHVGGVPAGYPKSAGKSGVAVPLTGSTSETTLATIVIPGGSLGANGRIEIDTIWSYTNSANNKIMRVKFGATTYTQITATTTASCRLSTLIWNRSATSQVAYTSVASGFGPSTGTIVTGSSDTNGDVSVTITGQLASGAETMTLEAYGVRITN